MLRHIVLRVQSPKFCISAIVFFEIIHNTPRLGFNLWLLDHAPWLLLVLSPATENAVAAASKLGLITFVLLGVIRRLIPKPIYYMAGGHATERCQDDDRLIPRLLERLAGIFSSKSEGKSQKSAGYLHKLGALYPNKYWLFAMGAAKVHPSRVAAITVASTTVEVLILYIAGEWFINHFAEYMMTVLVLLAGLYVLTVIWRIGSTRRFQRASA